MFRKQRLTDEQEKPEIRNEDWHDIVSGTPLLGNAKLFEAV